MNDNTKIDTELPTELDQWLWNFLLEVIGEERKGLPRHASRYDELKTYIQTLLTSEKNKARIDELEHTYVGLADIVSTNVTGTPQSADDRIEELESQIKGESNE